MAPTGANNKPFHTYENVGFEDRPTGSQYTASQPIVTAANTITTAIATNSCIAVNKAAIESPFPVDCKLRT